MKKIYTPKEWSKLAKKIKRIKGSGGKLIFTNGCFDVLHAGHEALLAFAKTQSGIVVVGLNSDESVRKLKGEGRPVNTARARANQLLKTGSVDLIVIYNEDTPQAITDYLEPDVLIKGDDYRFETTVGAPEVRQRGGEVLFFKKVPGLSTSSILSGKERNSETNSK